MDNLDTFNGRAGLFLFGETEVVEYSFRTLTEVLVNLVILRGRSSIPTHCNLCADRKYWQVSQEPHLINTRIRFAGLLSSTISK